MYVERSCTQPLKSALVITLGFDNSDEPGISRRTGAVSSVTRSAVGRLSDTGYGRRPGASISVCPYWSTTVPPARANDSRRGASAVSNGLAANARGPTTTAPYLERSAPRNSSGVTSVTCMPNCSSMGATLSPTPRMYAMLVFAGSFASTASISRRAARYWCSGRICS